MENRCLVCLWEWKSEDYPFICPVCKKTCWDFGDNIPCHICNKIQLFPPIHHINGVHDDNRKSNRLPLCKFCHGHIHGGDLSMIESKVNYYKKLLRAKNEKDKQKALEEYNNSL